MLYSWLLIRKYLIRPAFNFNEFRLLIYSMIYFSRWEREPRSLKFSEVAAALYCSFSKSEKEASNNFEKDKCHNDGIGWSNKWKLNSDDFFTVRSNAIYTDCTSKTLRVINAYYFGNIQVLVKYTLIDYIALIYRINSFEINGWDRAIHYSMKTWYDTKCFYILLHYKNTITENLKQKIFLSRKYTA